MATGGLSLQFWFQNAICIFLGKDTKFQDLNGGDEKPPSPKRVTFISKEQGSLLGKLSKLFVMIYITCENLTHE